jgi:hypothetical protein
MLYSCDVKVSHSDKNATIVKALNLETEDRTALKDNSLFETILATSYTTGLVIETWDIAPVEEEIEAACDMFVGGILIVENDTPNIIKDTSLFFLKDLFISETDSTPTKQKARADTTNCGDKEIYSK